MAKYLDNMSGGIGVVGDRAVVFEAIAAIAQVAEWTTNLLQNNRNPLWDFGVVSPVLIEAACHHSLGDNIAKRHSLLTLGAAMSLCNVSSQTMGTHMSSSIEGALARRRFTEPEHLATDPTGRPLGSSKQEANMPTSWAKSSSNKQSMLTFLNEC